MKITPQDFAKLKTAIASEPVQIFARAKLTELVKLHETPGNSLYQRDIMTRYRWDIFHAANRYQNGLIHELYETGLNDDHIYTALRRIIPDWTKQ